MINARKVRAILLAGVLLPCVLTLPGAGLAQTSGSVNWNGWTFTYEVSGNFDGLSLKGVQFQGLPLIAKISFPVVRVFYDNNACGPFADRVGGNLAPIPWAGNATIAQREFTLNGRQWYEIGIRPQVGNYDMYQVYYLSADGIMDAHIFSKGLACVVNHVHYPNWRIDFDINDPSNDQIQLNTAAGYQTKLNEFDANATEAINHGWRVRDSVTGNFVTVLPGFSDFTIPNETTQPATSYANNSVFGRLFKSSEDTGWTYGPNTQVPYNNGELISNADIVFWYEAYLAHSAAEGSSLWHSTGLRIMVGADTTPPTVPGSLSATAAGSSHINLSWTASTDTFGVTGYQVERCQGVGCSTFAPVTTVPGTSFGDSGLTAVTSYSYRVRATDEAGNLSGYSTEATAVTLAPDTTPPTVPTGLTATAAGSSQINLSWTASTDTVGVTGYLLERCQGAGCSSFTQIATPAGTTYSDIGLLAGTTYGYRVRATDADGNLSGYSTPASATTAAAPVVISFRQGASAVPQTPQTTVAVAFTAAQTAGNLNVVVVGWNDSSAIVSSVTDTRGNVYTRAVGPTQVAGALSQSIYYAKNIVAAGAGANAVTVRFDRPAVYADIR
ncbi:MAG: fibronectin type III domain-containing protein, partial [Nitrospiraceae bacterium]